MKNKIFVFLTSGDFYNMNYNKTYDCSTYNLSFIQ